MIDASREAMRIVRVLKVSFPTGPGKSGTGFLAPAQSRLITCAHVVVNDQGKKASRIVVSGSNGRDYEAKLLIVDDQLDLASLEIQENEDVSKHSRELPEIGEQVVFSGLPAGVARPSVFSGMISATGPGLLSRPTCDLIQISGMVNNGNSGGPLLGSNGEVLGVITAKYVPLLREIDKLTRDLDNIPQFPKDVAIGQVDFSAFVNLTIKSMWQLGAVLRLVQVGVGWAVPAQYLERVGGV